MTRAHPRLISVFTALFFVALFLFFFNGYRQSGPSRSKFQKLPGGVEDIAADEIKPEGEDMLLKSVEANKRIQKWADYWKRCLPDFTLGSMDDSGEAEIENEPVDMASVKAERSGPGSMFYIGAPGGGKSINPFYQRLVYKKEESGWQPYIELPCSALLYDSGKKSASVVLNCTIFEGIQDAVWLDKNRVALLGYESVTKQMDVQCETLETCAAPSIWVLDFTKGWVHSYRGKIVSRGKCDTDTYIKERLPRFFGKEK